MLDTDVLVTKLDGRLLKSQVELSPDPHIDFLVLNTNVLDGLKLQVALSPD